MKTYIDVIIFLKKYQPSSIYFLLLIFITSSLIEALGISLVMPIIALVLENNFLALEGDILYTFSGIAVYHSRFFNQIELGKKMQLLPLLNSSISKSLIKGELFDGIWSDIGTPERLMAINNIN